MNYNRQPHQVGQAICVGIVAFALIASILVIKSFT